MIAIDWGTSSLRCYRLDARANILESRASSYGILNVAPGQFPRVLDEQIAGWNETPIVMSGMVGSRQGWVEALRADALRIRRDRARAQGSQLEQATRVDRSRRTVPRRGSRCDARRRSAGARGWTTACSACRVHSKRVEVRNARIERFSTHMTGEVYAVLKQHSILGRMMEEGKPDPRALAKASGARARPAGCYTSFSAYGRRDSWVSSTARLRPRISPGS